MEKEDLNTFPGLLNHYQISEKDLNTLFEMVSTPDDTKFKKLAEYIIPKYEINREDIDKLLNFAYLTLNTVQKDKNMLH